MFHVKHHITCSRSFVRQAVLMLFVIILAQFILSCANVELPTDPSNNNSTEAETDHIRNQLPQTIQFAGEKITLFTDQTDRILADDSQIGSVKTAIENRNDFISSHYQITINVKAVDTASIAEKLKEDQLANVQEAHILCYPADTCAALFRDGLLSDIASLPDFATDKAYGEDLYSLSFSSGNKLYLAPSDSVPYYSDLYCLFYNSKWVDQLGMISPVDLVKRSEWTLSAFKNYVEKAAHTVMQKSSYDVAQDQFGYSARTKQLLVTLMSDAAGMQTYAKNESNLPELLSTSGSLTQEADILRSVLKSKARAPYYGGDASEAFLNGRLCFYIDKLSFIDVLHEQKMTGDPGLDYGILPLPAGINGNIVTPVDGSAPVLCVPKSTPDTQLSGLGMLLLIGAGRVSVKQAAIDSFLAVYPFNNDESCMLDIILRNTEFTFADLYGAGLDSIYDGTTGLLEQVLEKGGNLDSLLTKSKAAFDECIRSNFS